MKEFVEKLLVKDPRKRLECAKGATEIKLHPFFYGIKWPLIRTYRPPEVKGFIRRNKSNVTCKRNTCWWKRLGLLVRNKGGKYNLFSNYSNNNYYHGYKVR